VEKRGVPKRNKKDERKQDSPILFPVELEERTSSLRENCERSQRKVTKLDTASWVEDIFNEVHGKRAVDRSKKKHRKLVEGRGSGNEKKIEVLGGGGGGAGMEKGTCAEPTQLILWVPGRRCQRNH